MNTSLINETNNTLNGIVEKMKVIKDDYEAKLAINREGIEKELSKVNEYKSQFYEAKSKIQKMSDDIAGFEEDYRNLVEKFQSDDLSSILTDVSKEINIKIREKKRSIQQDQKEMNTLIDKAQEAKTALIKLTQEKKSLEGVYNQVNDVYTYYHDEFEQIIRFTEANVNNLHPFEDSFDGDKDDELDVNNIEIDEKAEIVTDEDVNKAVVVINDPLEETKELELSNIVISDDLEESDEQTINSFINNDTNDYL